MIERLLCVGYLYFYSPSFSGRQDGSSPHPEAEAHGHLPHLQVQR
jgi:hypothetical protein